MKALLFALLFIHPIFEWDSSHKLKWSDFEGVYNGSEESASTCTEISMEMEMDSTGGVVFIVKAIFHPEKSFISPTCSRSEKALKHEQLHFDIAEVYARQLRLLLHTMQHTHNQANVTMAGHFYAWTQQAWNHAEDVYDLESEHSQNEIGQKKWETIIRDSLAKSTHYANKSDRWLRTVH